MASAGLAWATIQALDWQSRAQTDAALSEPRSLRPEFSLRPDLTPWPNELGFIRLDSFRSDLERAFRQDDVAYLSATDPDTGEQMRLRFFRKSPQHIELRYQRESSSGFATGAWLAAGYFLMLGFFALTRRDRKNAQTSNDHAARSTNRENSQDSLADVSLQPASVSAAPLEKSQNLPEERGLAESSGQVVVIVPTPAPSQLRLAEAPRKSIQPSIELAPQPAAETPATPVAIEKPVAIGHPPIPANRAEATRALSFRLKSPMIFLAYSPRDSALVLECEAGFSSDDFSPHRLPPRVPFELDLRVFADGFEESARVFEESLPISRFLLNRYGVAFFEAIPWVRALSEIDPRVGNRFQGIFVVLQPGLESLSLKGQIRSQLSETWSDDDSKTDSRTENSSVTRPRDPLA